MLNESTPKAASDGRRFAKLFAFGGIGCALMVVGFLVLGLIAFMLTYSGHAY